MEAVIPPEVLEHLRSLSERSPLEGKFTMRQLSEALGCGESKARRLARGLLLDGKLKRHRVSLTDEEAMEVGNLAGGGLICYEWIETA